MGKPEENFHSAIEAIVSGQSLPAETRNEALRFNRQKAIEDAIVTFNPDYDEAFELVHAIWNGLETKCGDLPADVADALDDLCVALERAG